MNIYKITGTAFVVTTVYYTILMRYYIRYPKKWLIDKLSNKWNKANTCGLMVCITLILVVFSTIKFIWSL